MLRLEVGIKQTFIHAQDKFLANPELGLFGVFDGVGAGRDSGEAADLAAEIIWGYFNRIGAILNPLGNLLESIKLAHGAIVANVADGATTAIVGLIREDKLYWANVGDSRLYIKHKEDLLTQVSEDEGFGNVLNNWIGRAQHFDLFNGIHQSGIINLAIGDKLIFVSDGVTGDYGNDLLSIAELELALSADSAQQMAQNLIDVARKIDDQTALVIVIKIP